MMYKATPHMAIGARCSSKKKDSILVLHTRQGMQMMVARGGGAGERNEKRAQSTTQQKICDIQEKFDDGIDDLKPPNVR
jgi:hypothetical protein